MKADERITRISLGHAEFRRLVSGDSVTFILAPDRVVEFALTDIGFKTMEKIFFDARVQADLKADR